MNLADLQRQVDFRVNADSRLVPAILGYLEYFERVLNIPAPDEVCEYNHKLSQYVEYKLLMHRLKRKITYADDYAQRNFYNSQLDAHKRTAIDIRGQMARCQCKNCAAKRK